MILVVFLLGSSFLGALIGLQLITQLGITPNTSILGALLAMAAARLPLAAFRRFRSLEEQNLVQTAISGATFGAANALLLPLGVPWLLGRPDLVWPMFLGAALATLVDSWLLYRLFDSRLFPARGAWPMGVATAEALFAGDEGGRRGRILALGTVVGVGGTALGVGMSALGIALLGNPWALAMLGLGLLLRGYGAPLLGWDPMAAFAPHGLMIGAGAVALGQVAALLVARRHRGNGLPVPGPGPTLTVARGFLAYAGAAALLAAVLVWGGDLTGSRIPLFIVFAALAALASELVVGLSAMHAGWFPAFATALVFLVLAILMGFPPAASALLVGFTAATGPAFADMGYDLKTGWLVRGSGADALRETRGRRRQFGAEVLGLACAALLVAVLHPLYFRQDLIPPVDRVFAATIRSGASPALAMDLLTWALPGALLQALGGAARQMGILLATGLLIRNPLAGVVILGGIVFRLILVRRQGSDARGALSAFGAGCIVGDALWSFAVGTLRARLPKP